MGATIKIYTNRARLYDEVYKRKNMKKISDKKTDNSIVSKLLYEIITEGKADE